MQKNKKIEDYYLELIKNKSIDLKLRKQIKKFIFLNIPYEKSFELCNKKNFNISNNDKYLIDFFFSCW